MTVGIPAINPRVAFTLRAVDQNEKRLIDVKGEEPFAPISDVHIKQNDVLARAQLSNAELFFHLRCDNVVEKPPGSAPNFWNLIKLARHFEFVKAGKLV